MIASSCCGKNFLLKVGGKRYFRRFFKALLKGKTGLSRLYFFPARILSNKLQSFQIFVAFSTNKFY